jgi:CheY-like chemotaxis protein
MAEMKRVLIVEDEALTALALESYIEGIGHKVVGLSASGEDAVRQAKSEKPDLVFMDVRLAGKMDGMEAARLIDRDRSTAIVIISGYTRSGIDESAYKPRAYLSKPIDFAAIDEILKEFA